MGYLMSGIIWNHLNMTCHNLVKHKLIYDGSCLKDFIDGFEIVHPLFISAVIIVISVWVYLWGFVIEIYLYPYIVLYVYLTGSYLPHTGFLHNIHINQLLRGEGVFGLPVHWTIPLKYFSFSKIIFFTYHLEAMWWISLISANISLCSSLSANLSLSTLGKKCTE